MKLNVVTGALLLTLSSSSVVAGVVQQENSLIVGYNAMLDADNKNPGAYDQGYFSSFNRTVSSWGEGLGWIKVENLLNQSDNQKGQPAGGTVKAWFKLDPNIMDSDFNLWLQSYTVANSIAHEENLYLGLSYDLSIGKVSGKFGVGAHYGFGSFNPTNLNYNGMTGYASVLALGYPISKQLFVNLYLEGQFNRSEEHQAFDYKDIGYQSLAKLTYNLTPKIFVAASYRYRDSWGGIKADGCDMSFEVGYRL